MELFYGNISKKYVKTAQKLSYEMEMVFEYFKSEEFMFPNEDASYMEIAELTPMVQEYERSPKKVYKEQDIDLRSYLTTQSQKMGLSKSEAIKLTDNYFDLISPLVLNLKQYWNRARPYQYAYYFDLDFHPFYTKSGNSPAYPSGHTLQAMSWKKAMDEINPSLSNKTQKIVDSVNQSRMSLGVHFPSDIAFSKEICTYLSDNNLLP